MMYYGTSLDESGHCLWDLIEDEMYPSEMNYDDLPFDPERLSTQSICLGEVDCYAIDEYSIVRIEGSCADTRGESKSVFFEQNITTEDLLKEMLNTPIVMKIINKMPFNVEYFKKK